ncbi:MAG: hypothetical protein U0840_02270 [Gemmataceae bacterium]
MLTTVLTLALLCPAEVRDSDLDRLRRQIVPSTAEQAWLRLDWEVTLWDAVVRAQKEDRPILFYAMNGHPMAVC